MFILGKRRLQGELEHLPELKGGPTRELERNCVQGHAVIGEGGMALKKIALD